MKLPALCSSEQAARASAVGRSCCQQLNGVIRQSFKDLDPICVKVESEEVDARIWAVRHNRCRVPLRFALLMICGHHSPANERSIALRRRNCGLLWSRRYRAACVRLAPSYN